MSNVTFRVTVAIATFLIGVCAVMFWAFSVRKSQPPPAAVAEKPNPGAAASAAPHPENEAGEIKKVLTKAEATQRFEEFVAENGYTDLPPTEDKSKLVPEPVFGGVDDGWIKFRHNTLERRPAEVTKGNRFSGDGWAAFFFRKQPCEYCSTGAGRLIYMDAYGENLRVEHLDVFLTKPRKRKKAR